MDVSVLSFLTRFSWNSEAVCFSRTSYKTLCDSLLLSILLHNHIYRVSTFCSGYLELYLESAGLVLLCGLGVITLINTLYKWLLLLQVYHWLRFCDLKVFILFNLDQLFWTIFPHVPFSETFVVCPPLYLTGSTKVPRNMHQQNHFYIVDQFDQTKAI